MAYEIADFNGGKKPSSVTDPYGYIKDDPLGTTMDEKSFGDIFVLMQRMMDLAAMIPNHQPDNEANGYQLMDALLSHCKQQAHLFSKGIAQGYLEAMSTIAPVRISGVEASPGGLGTIVTPGWIMYNNQYTFCVGANIAVGAGVLLGTITQTLGVPVLTWSYAPTVTDPVHFPYDNIRANPITTGEWQALPLTANWGVGAIAPEIRIEPMGRIWLRGRVVVGAGATTDIANLPMPPIGQLPNPGVQQTFPVAAVVSGNMVTRYITVDPSGLISTEPGTFAPGNIFYLDGVTYMNS